jgi:NADPH2:quinone reductase
VTEARATRDGYDPPLPAAFLWQGGYGEVASVPAYSLLAVSAGTSFGTAAAMVVNYHTVVFALDRRGRVREAETVLVLGAAGGIGTPAIQVPHGLGARAIGGVANVGQRATALSAGADNVWSSRRASRPRTRCRAGSCGRETSA